MGNLVRNISLDKRGVKINGEYNIMLCASLFYFRIPSGLWRDRMRKIRDAGYNCIDVYFPWNFHETEKGKWSFEGERDVDLFLTMAGEEGLFVMARPGPYICSEWDGGALPAYLFTERDMVIRDNDDKYLAYVEEWYRRILPIISKHQVTRGGTVAIVQLENELDFYDCQDRHGYMLALKNMAVKYGIEVPCIACAGQGDIYGAWGDTEGVVPSTNLYLDPYLPDLEQELSYFTDQMEKLNIPLMVTETGRVHLLLRRLLSSSAKLLGPYNQVAGTDFGFTTSVNNWGNPLSFQTTNYDFKSLIDSFGRTGDEVHEARLLSGFINSMGQALAGSLQVRGNHDFEVKTDGTLPYTHVPVLSLLQENYPGYAVSITNAGDNRMSASVSREGDVWPKATKMIVEPGTSRFVIFDYDMSDWGLQGRIVFSSAEPVNIVMGDTTVIVFHALVEGEVHFEFDGVGQGEIYTFTFDGSGDARQEIRLPSGKTVVLYGISSDKASRLSRVTYEGLSYLGEDQASHKEGSKALDIQWEKTVAEDEKGDMNLQVKPLGERAVFMEEAGLFRGYGWYYCEYDLNQDKKAIGVLLHHAADVATVYCNGQYLGTSTPAGGYAFVPIEGYQNQNHFDISVRTEIWGHSNFDDSRQPALRIKSLRGISDATLVTDKLPLLMWKLKLDYRDENPYEIKTRFGGWFSTRKPLRCRYYRSLAMPANADRFLLQFEGLKCKATVEINGTVVGQADTFNSYVDISPFVEEGQQVQISIVVDKRYHAEPSGNVYLLTGKAAYNWSLAGCEQDGMWNAASTHLSPKAVPAETPLNIPSGSVMWLFGRIEGNDRPNSCHILRFRGKNTKLTVFFNGTVVGRIWLPSPNRPVMAGGSDDVAYLPGCWFREDGKNQIAIMVEGVVKGETGLIETIEGKPVAEQTQA